MQRRFKIRFDSDWHIGSGAGIPGSIDRQVLRDADGLPYIPGKTLTGVIRDAAEWIADIRNEHDNTRGWHDVLISLFGEQPDTHKRSDIRGNGISEARNAAVGIADAELYDDVRKILNDDGYDHLGLKSALFSARAGVKIDRETGRSEDNMLFSMERTRSDCVLISSVSALRQLSDDERALLDDAVKAVRRIGGKRRRGAGSCRLEWLDDDWHDSVCGESNGKTDMFSGNGDVMINVRLKTLQPMIINKITLGNEVKSDTVIHGTYLLPYFANDVFKAVDKDFMRKCVINGDISVSTLLPEFDGMPSLSAPLCLAENKESKEKVNRMVSGQSYDDSGKPVQMKDIRSGFVTVKDGVMTHHSAAGSMVVRTHNTVEDETQRPKSEVGGLFTYEAIGAGSSFMGTLRISKPLADMIRALSDDERSAIARRLEHDVHSFGRSKKDEYGTAELRCSVGKSDDKLSSLKLRDDKFLIVLLRSELLIRGENGGWSVGLDDVKDLLQKRLGVELSGIDDDWTDDGRGGRVSPIGGCRGHSIRIDRRESWHSGWTLPRPSLLCFKAGSIFMFKVTNPEKWDENKAEAIVRDGLGERRAEGYGQVLINPPFLFDPNVGVCQSTDSKSSNDRTQTKKSPVADLKDDEHRRFITALAETSMMRRFRRTARREAFNIVTNGEPEQFANFKNVKLKLPDGRLSVTTSQFGSLREAAASVEAVGNTTIFKRWAESLSKRDADRNRWNNEWIDMFKLMADNPCMIWDMRHDLHSLRDNFKQILPDIDSAKFMGIFFDLLCEAVFDYEKQHKKEAGGESE